MAKLPTEIIVALEPEVMDLLRNLVDRIEALEQGWHYMARCHDCQFVARFVTLKSANEWVDEHAVVPLVTGSRQFHAPYLTPVVKL